MVDGSEHRVFPQPPAVVDPGETPPCLFAIPSLPSCIPVGDLG